MLHLFTCHGRIMPRLAELLSISSVRFCLDTTLWGPSLNHDIIKNYAIMNHVIKRWFLCTFIRIC